jgi:hypothetical protein
LERHASDGNLPTCAAVDAHYFWYGPQLEHRHGSKRGRYGVEGVHRNSSAGTRRDVRFGRNNLSLLSKVAPGIEHG